MGVTIKRVNKALYKILTLIRARGGGENALPSFFFALISVKMIILTWDLFLKSFLVVADNISKEPHGVQRQLKVGRVQQEYDFLDKEAYHISNFQDLGAWCMFLGYFFKGNPNFEVIWASKAISRVQVNFVNSNPMDMDREYFIFLKYAHDTCFYVNFSRGIQILMLQKRQWSSRGSRWTMRTTTPGTRTGSSSIFSNIHVMHVHMPIF